MDEGVFRKTDAGHAEVRTRRGGLEARERTVLILANGQLTQRDLALRMGVDPRPFLQRLLAAGLLEWVAPARAAPRAPATPPVAAPAPALPTPAVAPAEVALARRRALVLLAPHYGPDTPRLVQGLVDADGDEAAFRSALTALQAVLSVNMGKRLAGELVRRIAPWVD